MSKNTKLGSRSLSVARRFFDWGRREKMVGEIFGLERDTTAHPILDSIRVPEWGIVFITGYSGSGKTTLLEALGERIVDAAIMPVTVPRDRSPISLLPFTVKDAIRWLGRFGLGEAIAMVTPYERLSVGQQLRVRLALLMSGKPKTVIIDEFLTGLDTISAAVVAYNFQRICRQAKVTAFLASAQEHFLDALAPDHIVRLDLHGKAEVKSGLEIQPKLAELDRIQIVKGSSAHYGELARFHYAEDFSVEWDDPRLDVRVALLDQRVIAVGICGPPLPKAYDAVPLLRRLNESVLCLLRTVVHPAFRGAGITKLLLPQPARTIRLLSNFSAMGRFVPFRLAHGFAIVSHPRSKRRPQHAQLESCLARRGCEDTKQLLNPALAQTFYDGLTTAQRKRLRTLVTAILVADNVEGSLFLAEHAELPVTRAERAMLEPLYHRVIGQVRDSSFGLLLSESLYFPMQGFIKKIPVLPAQ